MDKVLQRVAMRVVRGMARELGLLIREFALALVIGERAGTASRNKPKRRFR